MANVKMLVVSNDVLLQAVHERLRNDPEMYTVLAGSILSFLRPALAALPPDAHIVDHTVLAADGTVMLQIASSSFPWVPEGMPFDQIPLVATNVVHIGWEIPPGTHLNPSVPGELIKDGTGPVPTPNSTIPEA